MIFGMPKGSFWLTVVLGLALFVPTVTEMSEHWRFWWALITWVALAISGFYLVKHSEIHCGPKWKIVLALFVVSVVVGIGLSLLHPQWKKAYPLERIALSAPTPPTLPDRWDARPGVIHHQTAPPLTKHVDRPTGFLQIDKPVPTSGYTSIAPGRQIGMNFRSLNPTQQRVLRAFGYTLYYIEAVDPQVDSRVNKKAEEIVVKLRKAYANREIGSAREFVKTPVFVDVLE